MNENGFLKFFCIIAFLAFAAVSCWATAESLHLLLSSWPLVMCWVVTVGFFVIASFGTKMIVDSLNQKIYLEKRGLHLCGGIIILLIFWLLCSMPTNTHTFFYRNTINDKVTTDISTTESYLKQIKDNTVTERKIQSKCSKLRNDVEIKLGELKAEIYNGTNPGPGTKFNEILKDFAGLLGVAKIEPLNIGAKSINDYDRIYEEYRKKIYILLENRIITIVEELTPPDRGYQKIAGKDYDNLKLVEDYIEDGTLDLNNAEDIKTVCDKLNKGYNTIRNYQQFVEFKDQTDEVIYTSPNAVTEVKRMISVFDVWKDFINGEYAGHGFIFWVIISILVDVAAFIFFDIAFRRRN